MCYGFQEWYTHCRHGGIFHITKYCYNLDCSIRIEENVVHLFGWCPFCPDDGTITHNLPRRDMSPFYSIQHLESYYEQELKNARDDVEELASQYKTEQESGGENCGHIASSHARALEHYEYLRKLKSRDVELYRADEMAKDDMDNYAWAAEVRRV